MKTPALELTFVVTKDLLELSDEEFGRYVKEELANYGEETMIEPSPYPEFDIEFTPEEREIH